MSVCLFNCGIQTEVILNLSWLFYLYLEFSLNFWLDLFIKKSTKCRLKWILFAWIYLFIVVYCRRKMKKRGWVKWRTCRRRMEETTQSLWRTTSGLALTRYACGNVHLCCTSLSLKFIFWQNFPLNIQRFSSFPPSSLAFLYIFFCVKPSEIIKRHGSIFVFLLTKCTGFILLRIAKSKARQVYYLSHISYTKASALQSIKMKKKWNKDYLMYNCTEKGLKKTKNSENSAVKSD